MAKKSYYGTVIKISTLKKRSSLVNDHEEVAGYFNELPTVDESFRMYRAFTQTQQDQDYIPYDDLFQTSRVIKTYEVTSDLIDIRSFFDYHYRPSKGILMLRLTIGDMLICTRNSLYSLHMKGSI